MKKKVRKVNKNELIELLKLEYVKFWNRYKFYMVFITVLLIGGFAILRISDAVNRPLSQDTTVEQPIQVSSPQTNTGYGNITSYTDLEDLIGPITAIIPVMVAIAVLLPIINMKRRSSLFLIL